MHGQLRVGAHENGSDPRRRQGGVVKALGLDGFDPLDVEVLDGGERCAVALHGAAAERAEALGVMVTISLTHLESMAAAVALARPIDRP